MIAFNFGDLEHLGIFIAAVGSLVLGWRNTRTTRRLDKQVNGKGEEHDVHEG